MKNMEDKAGLAKELKGISERYGVSLAAFYDKEFRTFSLYYDADILVDNKVVIKNRWGETRSI